MELTVNGDTRTFDETLTVAQLLTSLDLPDTGVAVAVNGVVRPKVEWSSVLPEYAEIDILTAVQGG
ncbi:sulfur carrier protein ThiS [Gordonia sp. (in: high G+C Gram-positive bacteria)]|uniref:sulfur carrier protein ThiS n=1 Tax=Gordonia sp. (in: high G+C Gram-positive bacteria) TaxID=84139 RepID=UPI00169EA8BD|nr:sulfur carrier protein ThiS [Gordonia sp. (in: high G+C Gram-positive bacteria)]NLG45592.1 sulfur carrier protein ThiS [Gordonia sp. (in: high G+C Gram-positive bacteria)]